MEQELRHNLLECLAELKTLTGLSEQSIAQSAINDNTFFIRLTDETRSRPAGFTIRTYDRLMDWMSDRKTKALNELGKEAQ